MRLVMHDGHFYKGNTNFLKGGGPGARKTCFFTIGKKTMMCGATGFVGVSLALSPAVRIDGFCEILYFAVSSAPPTSGDRLICSSYVRQNPSKNH